MKQLKVANAIPCEYITIGAGAKPILVHAYSGDIRVREFPARFPLSFYIELCTYPDMPSELTVEVLQNKKKRAELKVEFEKGPEKIGLLIIPPIVFTIEKDSDIRVVARGDGIRDTTLVRKRVSVGEIPAT